MLKSKALKEPPKRLRDKLHDMWLLSPIVDAYYHWSWKLWGNPVNQLKKTVQWWWHVWRRDFDFDGHSLYAIIEYKLIRIQKALEKGYAVQEDRDMQALKLAIKLAGRLKTDDYDERGWRKHDAKWGKLNMKFIPMDNGCSSCEFSRPNASTDQEKEQETKEHIAYSRLAESIRIRDKAILFNLLNKYLDRWWD